jgi:hypothetical protein
MQMEVTYEKDLFTLFIREMKLKLYEDTTYYSSSRMTKSNMTKC